MSVKKSSSSKKHRMKSKAKSPRAETPQPPSTSRGTKMCFENSSSDTSSSESPSSDEDTYGELSEEDLIHKEHISPMDVKRLGKPASNFLVSPKANIYEIVFTAIKVRSIGTDGRILHQAVDPNPRAEYVEPPAHDDSWRTNQYDFGAGFLDCEAVGSR